MKTIRLPIHGIIIQIEKNGAGAIVSDLHENVEDDWHDLDPETRDSESAVNVLESLILAHAVAGVNIESPEYLKGIEIAIDAITNNL